MRRTGFKRPQIERKRSYPSAAPAGLAQRVSMARCDTAATPVPKDEPVRHEGYRRLVAMYPCKNCGISGYSQAAHPNTGKGMGTKTDDRLCFPLCADRPGEQGCHPKFDQHAMFPKEVRQRLEVAWGADTRRQIEAKGLWPANLPRLES